MACTKLHIDSKQPKTSQNHKKSPKLALKDQNKPKQLKTNQNDTKRDPKLGKANQKES